MHEVVVTSVRRIGCVCTLAILAACEVPPPDPELVAQRCEQRARGAQGPSGAFSVGVNSQTGPEIGAAIGVTTDFLNGRDPLAVYYECVLRATGEEPIRPPRLR